MDKFHQMRGLQYLYEEKNKTYLVHDKMSQPLTESVYCNFGLLINFMGKLLLSMTLGRTRGGGGAGFSLGTCPFQ